MLIYRAKLPLVDKVEYLNYKLNSWPVPYNASGYSIKVKTVNQIGINSLNNNVFINDKCIGNNPVVCRIGVKYGGDSFICERGILNGNDNSRSQCDIEITKTSGNTLIHEILPGEYIVITWGEEVVKRCIKEQPVSLTLVPGVYVIDIQNNCMFYGKNWNISPMLEFSGRLSIMSLKVDIKPLKLKEVITEKHGITLLNQSEYKGLLPVYRSKMTYLKSIGDDEFVATVNGWHYLYISAGVVVFIIIVIVSSILMYKYHKCCRKCYDCKQGNKDNIAHTIEVDKCTSESEKTIPLVSFGALQTTMSDVEDTSV